MNIIELNLEETFAVVGGASASTAETSEAKLKVRERINVTSLEASALIPAPVMTTFSASANASA